MRTGIANGERTLGGREEISPDKLKDEYIQLLEYGCDHLEQLDSNLVKLKDLIARYGLPPETEDEETIDIDRSTTLRGHVWLVLLGIRVIDVEEYKMLVEKGPSQAHKIIERDAVRTFPKETKLRKRVPHSKIIRVLNAFQHKVESDGIDTLGYIQGLNCLVTAFLYHMPEVEAFFAFYEFVTCRCPRYCGCHLGVSDGDVLVNCILSTVDPVLYDYLGKNSVNLVTFSHPSLQSLLTDIPPLDEAWKLWDMILAYGAHLAVIFIACILIIRREEILSTSYPNLCFQYHHSKGRNSSLDASLVISLALCIIDKIPEKLYFFCERHLFKDLKAVMMDVSENWETREGFAWHDILRKNTGMPLD